MKPYQSMTRENTALLVIDVVNGCAHEKCEIPDYSISFSKIRTMVPKLHEFIETFRSEIGSLIIFTTITPWTKEYLPQNLNELYTDPNAVYYSHDTSGFSEQFYTVSPQDTDIVVAKNSYDALANTELRHHLQNKKIRYLVITGVFTDGCVLATICGGFSRGYNFVVLKDLIETTDVPTRQRIQSELIEYTFPVMYGKTMDSTLFLSSWKD